ncbi:SPOSA6832_00509, partial [Sporobolomyces salmonicolor]
MVNMQLDPIPSTANPTPSAGPALEDLFADEVDTKALLGIPSMQEPTEDILGDLSNPMVMRTYYSRLLPFKQMFLWLNQSHVPTKQFTHREFAVTLQNDAYLRYQSFNSAEELKQEIVRLNPSRFEIGPMYSGRPKDRKALMKSAFKPMTRELVFDIDMTDCPSRDIAAIRADDSVRTCCKDKKMCKRCWRFITVAVKVLDEILRGTTSSHLLSLAPPTFASFVVASHPPRRVLLLTASQLSLVVDFGFQHVLWVYSGRRGIHAWISDPQALELTDDQRSAIVRYIDIIKGYTTMDKKVQLPRPLHPALIRALRNLKPAFNDVVLADQDCFRTDPAQWEGMLKLLPDRDAAASLLKEFASQPDKSSAERWAEAARKYNDAVQDLTIQYTYPRIDTEVSRKLNHLLKAPFCVHPGTGKVCVPLLASQIDAFDPDQVPTVGKLLLELEQLARRGDTQADWGKTSLRPYVELFERHAEMVTKTRARETKAANAYSVEF